MMNKLFIIRARWLALAIALLAVRVLSPATAHADSVLAVDLNGARTVVLKVPATDVVVGNPDIADVSMQSPDHLIVIGKQPGRTRLMIFDANQKVIVNQVVIVTEGDVGLVSVYGPRKGDITQNDYACAYHCTIIPGEGPTGIKGGSNGAPAALSGGSDTNDNSNAGSDAPTAPTN